MPWMYKSDEKTECHNFQNAAALAFLYRHGNYSSKKDLKSSTPTTGTTSVFNSPCTSSVYLWSLLRQSYQKFLPSSFHLKVQGIVEALERRAWTLESFPVLSLMSLFLDQCQSQPNLQILLRISEAHHSWYGWWSWFSCIQYYLLLQEYFQCLFYWA